MVRDAVGYIEKGKMEENGFPLLTRGGTLGIYICSLKGLERAVDMDDTVSRRRLVFFFSAIVGDAHAIHEGGDSSRRTIVVATKALRLCLPMREKAAGRGPISLTSFLVPRIRASF